MILNYYDFINEILNNCNGEMLEEGENNISITKKEDISSVSSFYYEDEDANGNPVFKLVSTDNKITEYKKVEGSSDKIIIKKIIAKTNENGEKVKEIKEKILTRATRQSIGENNITVMVGEFVDTNNSMMKRRLDYIVKFSGAKDFYKHNKEGNYYKLAYNFRTIDEVIAHESIKDKKCIIQFFGNEKNKYYLILKNTSILLPVIKKGGIKIEFIPITELESAVFSDNKFDNRGDTGELLYFLVTCYGFYNYRLYEEQKYDDIMKEIYSICAKLNKAINNEIKFGEMKFIIKKKEDKVNEEDEEDKKKETYKIVCASPIHHESNNKDDILRGFCVIKKIAIEEFSKLKPGTFDEELGNCIEYFIGKYIPIISSLQNEIIEKVYVCSMGVLDGDEKKEDCTVYIKRSSDTNISAIVLSDDIRVENGKVMIDNCDRDEYEKDRSLKVYKQSLKNKNTVVGQFNLTDIRQHFNKPSGESDNNEPSDEPSKTNNTNKKEIPPTLDALLQELKLFCCIYLKMGAKNENSVKKIAAKRNSQATVLHNRTYGLYKQSAVQQTAQNSIYSALHEKMIEIVNKENFNNDNNRVMKEMLDVIVKQINKVYYKTNKKRYDLLSMLLKSAVALYDRRIDLFDMKLMTRGFTVREMMNLIRKANFNEDEKSNYLNTLFITSEEKINKGEDSTYYIKFKVSDETLVQIRLQFKQSIDEKTKKEKYDTILYIELMAGLKKLLK